MHVRIFAGKQMLLEIYYLSLNLLCMFDFHPLTLEIEYTSSFRIKLTLPTHLGNVCYSTFNTGELSAPPQVHGRPMASSLCVDFETFEPFWNIKKNQKKQMAPILSTTALLNLKDVCG